jgi:hypothetical protein
MRSALSAFIEFVLVPLLFLLYYPYTYSKSSYRANGSRSTRRSDFQSFDLGQGRLRDSNSIEAELSVSRISFVD